MFVLFLRWMYLAMSNVHALGAREVESPGWSVGSFFVPFVNLVMPYTAMSQIWRASLSAERWKEEAAPIVGIWWTLWLLVGVCAWISVFLGTDHHLAAALVRTKYQIAYTLMEIARNVVTAMLVAGVLARQSAQWRLTGGSEMVPVTPS
jgi:hypothetical protein